MNKNQYDMLTQVRDVFEGLAGGVDVFREVATEFVEDAALTVNDTVEKVIGKIDSLLEASPLEDPVVPTNGEGDENSNPWSKVSDGPRDTPGEPLPMPHETTEEFMREMLVKRLQYSEEKVAGMAKSEVEASYIGIIFGDMIVKKLKGKGGPLGF